MDFSGSTLILSRKNWRSSRRYGKVSWCSRRLRAAFARSFLARHSWPLTVQKQNSNHNEPEDFVFCKADGSPLNPDVLRRDVLYPLLDRLGIIRNRRAAGFHTFRHSVATIVNQKTGNLKLVQKLLGHSNLSTTADVYTHTSADADRSAALALEQTIFLGICSKLFQVWEQRTKPLPLLGRVPVQASFGPVL